MIPLRSRQPRSRAALVTWAIILANLVAFYFELKLGPALPRFIRTFGVRPVSVVSHWDQFDSSVWLPLLSSMFLHGGWLHLAGNMLFLWVFGGNVEDRMGHGRFLLLYLLAGFTAAFTQIIASPDSQAPMIGASGAIAGVLGAYLLLFPRARVLTLVPIFFIPFFWDLPAVVLLVIWFAGQFTSGVAALDTGQALYGGVAYWAHIGGFLMGMALALLLQPYRLEPRARNTWVPG
jgi:membrane associated rhomboid family serine protease